MSPRNILTESFEDFLVRVKLAQCEAEIRMWCRRRGVGNTSQPVKSPPNWWDERRERSLALAGNSCERCGRSGPGVILHMHHLTYQNAAPRNAQYRGYELDGDVQIVCVPCHKAEHPRAYFGTRVDGETL